MESRLTLGRGAAIRFLDGLRDEDVAAVYNFDVKVEQIQDFSPGRDLPAKAFTLKTRNMTSLNDAVLQAAVDLGKREEKRRAIVVLSDGGENSSRASSDKALERALQVGATVVNWFVKMPAPGDNDTGSEKRLSDIGPEVVWLNTPSIAVVEICSSAKTDWGVLIPPVCVRPIKTPPVFHGR